MFKTFTHMGVFNADVSSQIILRLEDKFWVAPNGISYEKFTPILDIQLMPPRYMNGRERIN
jgi:hypothetical protein